MAYFSHNETPDEPLYVPETAEAEVSEDVSAVRGFVLFDTEILYGMAVFLLSHRPPTSKGRSPELPSS